MALELGLRLQVLFKDPNISIFFETQGQGKTGVAETGNTLGWGNSLSCYGESMSCCALF